MLVDQVGARDARDRGDLAGAGAVRRAGRRRGGLPDHRGQGRPAGPRRRHADHPGQPGDRAAAGLRRPQADGVLRAVSGGRRRLPGAAGRAGQAPAERRVPGLRAGDLDGARVRVPLRLPRPAAHGDHQGAAGARVRPGADLDRAERRLPGRAGVRQGDDRHQPERVPRGQGRPDLRARRPGHGPGAHGLRRRDHGTVPEPPRRPARHGVPVGRPGRDPVHDAARRDHLRLLRPAQVAHPRLRLTRLRARRASRNPTWSRSTSCSRACRSTPSARSCTPTRPATTA